MKLTKEQLLYKLYEIKRIMEFDIELIENTIDELDENGASFDLLDEITAPLENDLNEMTEKNGILIREMENNY